MCVLTPYRQCFKVIHTYAAKAKVKLYRPDLIDSLAHIVFAKSSAIDTNYAPSKI